MTYGLPVCPGRRDIDVGAGACLPRRRHGLTQPIVGTAFRAVDFGPGHSTMKQTRSDGVSGSANDAVEANREHKEELNMGKRITPCLWFDGNAEDAANFYVATFPDSEILDVQRWGEGGNAPAGTVLTVSLRLGDTVFTALNGGPEFKFTEAVSFQIDCESQDEVDHYWNTLTTDGGEESCCGWLKDKFGLSWQVIPRRLMELLQDPDADKANRAMQAMLQMRKIDVAKLEEAAA